MVQRSILLSVEELSKTYKGPGRQVHALKNVSFHVYEGELLAIMGTNGSGKNTLLHILGAMDEPDQGKIKLNGKYVENIFREPYATYYRQENIGFIFQSLNLLKDLTVKENIALPLILKGESDFEVERKVKGMIELIGLTPWKYHRPKQLLRGQQQRVAIARVLICSPSIILADELTGNLDFNTTTEVLNVLAYMKEQLNQSMIMVTHDPYVATFADRVLFFNDGQIVDEYICKKRKEDMNDILNKFNKVAKKQKRLSR